MDVDNQTTEDAMETDPPVPLPQQPPVQLTRKDSSIDPDGDEQMDAGEELYDDEGDVEIGEGEDGEGQEDVDERVDADGDITPVEADGVEEVEAEEEEYYEEEGEGEGEAEGEAEEDVEIPEGDHEGIAEAVETAPTADEEPANTAVEGTDTALTAPIPTRTDQSEEAAQPAAEDVGETQEQVQADAGNVAVQPTSSTTDNEFESDTKSNGPTIAVVGVASTVTHEDADQAQDHYDQDQDEYDDEGMDDGEEESYEPLTYDTLPPILLNLPNAQRALFNPFVAEDGTSPPIWFAEKVQEFSEGTLTLLWSAIREKLDEEGLGSESDEMVITEKLTDLKMGDSDVNLEDVTFLELVQMYHDCELPEPMELHVAFQPHRFITRFNAIQKELQAREVVYFEDEDDEHEHRDEDVNQEQEGEGEEHGVEGAEGGQTTHEAAETAQSAEAGPTTDTEATQTDQLPAPLPKAEAPEPELEMKDDTAPVVTEADSHASNSNSADAESSGKPITAVSVSEETGTAPADENDKTAGTTATSQDGTSAASVTNAVLSALKDDSQLIGTPEIRAAEAVNPIDQSTGSQSQPEALDIATVAETSTSESAQREQEPAEASGITATSGGQDDSTAAANPAAGHEATVGAEPEEALPAGSQEVVGTAEAEPITDGVEVEVAGELEEEEYDEGEEEEQYDDNEQEQDPYGVDKFVDGVDEEGQQGDEDQDAAGVPDAANGEEEEIVDDGEQAEYQDELVDDAEEDAGAGLADVAADAADQTNGATHDDEVAEAEEPSPAKRGRSVDVEEGEEGVGKRAKTGDETAEAQ